MDWIEDDEDGDLICALMASGGWSQDEIDRYAPLDAGDHWLSKQELERRLRFDAADYLE